MQLAGTKIEIRKRGNFCIVQNWKSIHHLCFTVTQHLVFGETLSHTSKIDIK